MGHDGRRKRDVIRVPERPKILQIGPVPPPITGGIAEYIDGMRTSALSQRFDLLPFDVTVPDLYRKRRSLRPVLSLKFLARLVAQLWRETPDLVHVHTSAHFGFWEKALLAAIVGARGIPVVFHLHGGDFDRFLIDLRPRPARLVRRVLHKAAAVIATCEAWRDLVERFAGAGRVVVVPNAIRCDAFPRRPETRAPGPVRLLFLGFVSARKGMDELLQAAQELLRTNCTDFQLDVVGGEEFHGDLERYRKRYAKAGLGERVRFHGMQVGADKMRFLSQADVFVLPSRSESFGIANLEAMASGLPIVSTRTGAIPEYLEPGVQGELVEPGDVPGLVEALRRLIADPALRRRQGEAARQRSLAYDWSHVAAQVAAVYDAVLATQEPAGCGGDEGAGPGHGESRSGDERARGGPQGAQRSA